MIYIDPLFETEGLSSKWPYPEACHMMADSIDELLEFAKKLGLRSNWIQVTSVVHFDLTRNKRYHAIRLGAVEVDDRFRPAKYREQVIEAKGRGYSK